jgi:hypothetical protein
MAKLTYNTPSAANLPGRPYRTEWPELQAAWNSFGKQAHLVIPMQMNPINLKKLENQIKDWMDDLDATSRKFQYSFGALAQILARANQKFAREMSAGPIDPLQRMPRQAWKIPVRRISGFYYQGWFVRRIAPGIWQLYNPTREAYYIEYGIHSSNRRVRRPIRKMSLVKTLRWADTVGVGNMVWEEIYGPLRIRGAARRRGASVNVSPQSGKLMPYLANTGLGNR